jgi:hypothetical protein
MPHRTLAIDVALAAGLRLHRLVVKAAVDRRNSGGRVAKVAAFCKDGIERQPVGARHVPLSALCCVN